MSVTTKEKALGVVTLNGMECRATRNMLARWLRKLARDLEKEGQKYSHQFRARIFV